jgi:hypothetical protein
MLQETSCARSHSSGSLCAPCLIFKVVDVSSHREKHAGYSSIREETMARYSLRRFWPAAFILTSLLSACGIVPSPSVEQPLGDLDEATEALGGCGVERWSVKTGTDPDVGSVSLTPIPTTIAALTGIRAPGTLPPNNRISPQERQVFTLRDITLVSYKLENDSDYHLVISDGSRTMITEITAPSCAGPGPLFSGITSSRNAFDARFHPTSQFQTANITATVTGVGFFDFQHGQTGVAPNGIELHPVLSICFGAGCSGGGGSNDFSMSVAPTSRTIRIGTSGAYTVSTAVTLGVAQTVRFTATGLPRGVTATFNPTSVTAGGSSTLRVTVGTTASPASTSFTVTGRGTSATHAVAPQLTITR